MTVKELREMLAKFNDDTVVCFRDEWGDLFIAEGIRTEEHDGKEYAVIDRDVMLQKPSEEIYWKTVDINELQRQLEEFEKELRERHSE